MKRPARLAALALVAAVASASPAGEIGFVEDFALAKDRAVPLKQLIPGTEDYYYYHCLHYQNAGQLDQVEEVLKSWIARRGHTARVEEIRNRQGLLKYDKDPQGSLAFLRQRLKLRFNHQKETLAARAALPTSLEAKLISRETLTKRAFGRYQNLNGFEDRALDWLAETKLNGDRLRDLIRRLRRPDVANLPKLVVADLAHRHSRGFGSEAIHRAMLRSQLDECLKLKPDLLNQTNFVNIYLTKLRPAADEDWLQDPKQRAAYLLRLWEFARRLAPVHNSLKAHVLYQRLVLDRSQGVYDKGRFMTYVKLPRPVPYVNPEYLRRFDQRSHRANLGADYRAQTLLSPVGNDEPLVRSYLMHFFVEEDSYKPYQDYVRDTYLKRVLAEAKLVNGLGDSEKWTAMLSPSENRALTDRVGLDFAYTNKKVFAPGEKVGLDVQVKNVEKLIVKVFEINALNYYRDHQREIGTDVDLDGLVANAEKVYTYKVPPVRRVRRRFDFPKLKLRGVYVIEFIGNGKSSRAVVRRGQLRYLERTSTAGHVFTVLNEADRKLPDAKLWLAGRLFDADEDGVVTVPFSTKPGAQKIVLIHGDFATLADFRHQAEQYRLAAGFHVDRESLLTRKKASVLIRPMLYLNGEPVTLSVLEDVTLTITSTDHDGVRTSKEVRDFKLFEDRESAHEFRVPERLAAIRFTLTAEVQNLSQSKKVLLGDTASFTLNQIETTDKVEDLHLVHIGGQYHVDVLGKTGEARPARPVALALKHRDFRNAVQHTLGTDPRGRIALGELKDIDWVTAKGPEGTSHKWLLARDEHTYPRHVHGRAGQALHLPYMGGSDKPLRAELALLELRGGSFVKDWFGSLKIKDGFVVVDDVPAGDYRLFLKLSGNQIDLSLAPGQVREGYVLAPKRHLQVRNPKPLQIAAVEVDKDKVTIRLANATKFARVHVAATRYMPEYSIYSNLGRLGVPGPARASVASPESLYVAGRNIGDEYRYILDRKYAAKFPGNMLKRPELLLNPWAIRKTEAGRQVARPGEAYRRVAAKRAPSRAFGLAGRAPRKPAGKFANLDFLAEPSAVLANLRPDAKGVVTIQRKDLGAHQQIHVVAVDPENVAYREVSLAEVKPKFKDLRLIAGLAPDSHFAEKKQISVVKKGEKFALADITTSRFEAYDSLAKVYALYATLSKNPTLTEFGFILRWPEMKPQEKRQKYSKYACHELSFFISRKDPDFFKQVVRPYLANKKDKTFLDHWLLGDDLSGCVLPWAHTQLNIVEKILLARRIRGEPPATRRFVKELLDLIPPDIERFNHLFDTALKTSALEAEEGLALKLGDVADNLMELKKAEKEAAGRRQLARLTGVAKPGRPPAPAARPAAARPADAPKKTKALRSQLADRDANGAVGLAYFKDDGKRRARGRQLYRKLDKTQEWVENNYYHLPIERQNADLITVNAFWDDYAAFDGKGEFFSPNLAEASRSFPEMMLALSVLDLPFKPGEHKTEFKDSAFTLDAAGALVAFHRQIRPVAAAAEKTPILVSQNFFRHKDRYRHVNNERLDKYVTDEFLVHVVYGCHVVITNPTSSRQKLDLLVQVPRGSIPVLKGRRTRSVHMVLEPYSTKTLEYYFYFPAAGEQKHFPVHVTKNEKLIASAEPVTLKVVEKLSKVDRTSWDWISQHGTADQVIEFLRQHNLNRIKLARIAWRVRKQDFFKKVIALLAGRHAYDHTLWSYGIRHNEVAVIREYLQHCNAFVRQCGDYIDTKLLTIDPVIRKSYQHMEYSPLVNARAHQLGRRRRIVNERFSQQYHRLMKVLGYRAKLDDDDLMAVTYYLLLQDRVAEGLEFFKRVKAGKLAARLQHDYFAAYTDFYTPGLRTARAMANKYTDHGVDRWRKIFANVAAQLDEIEGKAAKVVDEKDRAQQQAALAATEPSLEFTVEAGKVTVNYQNVKQAVVNYYLMDIELLFSRQPFVKQYAGQFAYIRPNETAVVKLPAGKATHVFGLPRKFHNANVMIEIIAGGVKRSQAHYSNALTCQVVEHYGQLKVTHAKSGKALPKVYVKVYARMQDGRMRFYKDGYTDLRGRFDYSSLNTNELDFVQRFALLVLSDAHGAVVREAAPPKR